MIQPKVIADYVIAWLKVARMLIVAYRRVEVAQLAGDIAEHEEGHIGMGFQLRSCLKKGLRRRHTVFLPLSQPFVDEFTRRWLRGGSRGNRCRSIRRRPRRMFLSSA